MELPFELKAAIEKQTEGMSISEMKQIAGDLSHKYRKKSGKGEILLTEEAEAAVYSAVRMPATFGAVFSALNYVLECVDLKACSLLDVGAGTGAAAWAADALLELNMITCMEREAAMQKVGKSIMQQGSSILQRAEWVSGDLVSDDIPQADLVIASYVLNELLGKNFLGTIDKLWQAAQELLLIVEPGTPQGYTRIRMAREYLLLKGADIAAPCPHNMACPMPSRGVEYAILGHSCPHNIACSMPYNIVPSKSGENWCHFTCRIARSRLHRLLKDGEAPYEDEKFSYMAFAKKKTKKVPARVLRHPYTGKGYVSLDVCNVNGIEAVMIRKKEKEFYKEAKKARCGDSIVLPEKSKQ